MTKLEKNYEKKQYWNTLKKDSLVGGGICGDWVTIYGKPESCVGEVKGEKLFASKR